MNAAVETHELRKHFGPMIAVDGLNLVVPAGSLFGFLGPNGAGKSTTMKMLTGLLTKSSGSASVLGYDIDRQPVEYKQRIGVVPEELALFDRLTASEYLSFVGRMYGLRRELIDSRSRELLELMELPTSGKKLIVDYSHGMKKKLAFSAAVIHEPQLLFLDEPFEGIDAIASRMIKNLMQTLRSRGVTIFVTSHILEIVEKLCTHIAIINRGKLVAHGTLEELNAGSGLEQRFLELVDDGEAKSMLSWLR